jgi:hypothetical protein
LLYFSYTVMKYQDNPDNQSLSVVDKHVIFPLFSCSCIHADSFAIEALAPCPREQFGKRSQMTIVCQSDILSAVYNSSFLIFYFCYVICEAQSVAYHLPTRHLCVLISLDLFVEF